MRNRGNILGTDIREISTAIMQQGGIKKSLKGQSRNQQALMQISFNRNRGAKELRQIFIAKQNK